MLFSILYLVVYCLENNPAYARGKSFSRSLLVGKTYVITGASSGFGKGVAELVGARGANVVLAARRTDLLEDIAANIRDHGGQAAVVCTDVAEREDLKNLTKCALSRFGKIDVWINDAGVGALGKFDDIPIEVHSRLVDVNLKSVIYGSHLALTQFKKQGQGLLINVSSVEGEIPLAYHASYAATKAAILGLDRALIQELRLEDEKNIRVSTIMPAATDTPWWQHAANYTGKMPRFKPMDPADKVVRAIVADSLNPKIKLLWVFSEK